MARVNEGSHSFTCYPHVYPQVEWTIPAFTPRCRASPHFGWYLFSVPLRVGGYIMLRLVMSKCVLAGWSVGLID